MPVDEDDGFKNDALGRQPFGEALLNIVTRSKDELVFSIDGQWGEGKTTFVKMWRGLLAENNIPSIYIDAFANDYSDDAFIVIASAITEFVEKNISKDNCEKVAELKEKTKRVGIQLLSWIARVGIKAATLNIIKEADIEALVDIKDEIAKGVSGWVGKLIEERLDAHSKEMDLFQSFRDLLSSISAKLEGSEGNPLVVILDELDRCKPTFAVDAVEKIKHLFSVQNVVFVLVLNKAQLEQSVKIVYGQELDAHTYLQKFINLETRIPKRLSVPHMNDASKYIRKLITLHDFKVRGNVQSIAKNTELLATHFNLTLRQLEKVFTTLAMFYGSIPENHFRPVQLIVFLVVVKVVNPLLFEKCLTGRVSYKEVSEWLGLSTLESDSEQWQKMNSLMNCVKFVFLSEKEFKDVPENHQHQMWKHYEGLAGEFWGSVSSSKQLLLIFSQLLGFFITEEGSINSIVTQ